MQCKFEVNTAGNLKLWPLEVCSTRSSIDLLSDIYGNYGKQRTQFSALTVEPVALVMFTSSTPFFHRPSSKS